MEGWEKLSTQGSVGFLEAEGLGAAGGGGMGGERGSGPQAQALFHSTQFRRRSVLTNVGKLDPSMRALLEGNTE